MLILLLNLGAPVFAWEKPDLLQSDEHYRCGGTDVQNGDIIGQAGRPQGSEENRGGQPVPL